MVRRTSVNVFLNKHRPWYQNQPENAGKDRYQLDRDMKEDWRRLTDAQKADYKTTAAARGWMAPDAAFPPPGRMAIPLPPVAQLAPTQQAAIRHDRARDRRRRALSLDPGRGPALPNLVRRPFLQLALPAFVPGPVMVHPGPLFPGLHAPVPVGPVPPIPATHAPPLSASGPVASGSSASGPAHPLATINPHAAGMQGFAPAIIDADKWQTKPIPVPPARLFFFDRPDDRQDNGIWMCVEKLGYGAFGEVHLWIRVHKSVVQQRIVGKDIELRSWDYSYQWYRREIDGVPQEAAMHYLASYSTPGDPGCDYILKYHGFRARKDLRMCRIATDYAEYGDLFDLTNHFSPKFEYPEKLIENDEAWNSVPRLPLRFVVELFKAMVIGLSHITKRGIIHRDLKSNNIFLGKPKPESDFFDWGVQPLIADFGYAVPIDSEEFQNPDNFLQEGGHAPIQAPEQIFTYPTLYQRPHNEKTNVFQLGYLMADIIAGRCLDYLLHTVHEPHGSNSKIVLQEMIWTSRPDEEGEDGRLDKLFCIPSLRDHFAILLNPVKSCLRFDQDKRPTFDDLLETVDDILEAMGDAELPRDGATRFEAFFAQKRHDLWGSKVVKVDKFGKPVNERRERIDHQGNRINSRGQRIDVRNRAIDDENHRINTLNQWIDRNGNAIDKEKRRIDDQNNLINKQGLRINDRNHLVDENGWAIDVFGRLIDEKNRLTNTHGDKVDEWCRRIDKEYDILIDARNRRLDEDGQLESEAEDDSPREYGSDEEEEDRPSEEDEEMRLPEEEESEDEELEDVSE